MRLPQTGADGPFGLSGLVAGYYQPVDKYFLDQVVDIAVYIVILMS